MEAGSGTWVVDAEEIDALGEERPLGMLAP